MRSNICPCICPICLHLSMFLLFTKRNYVFMETMAYIIVLLKNDTGCFNSVEDRKQKGKIKVSEWVGKRRDRERKRWRTAQALRVYIYTGLFTTNFHIFYPTSTPKLKLLNFDNALVSLISLSAVHRNPWISFSLTLMQETFTNKMVIRMKWNTKDTQFHYLGKILFFLTE